MRGAYNQIQTYKSQIPDLFTWNQVVVISDGILARAGYVLPGRLNHFAPWKTIDGKTWPPKSVPQIEVLVEGFLAPEVFLDCGAQFHRVLRRGSPGL
ncbi:MAG: type I restriction endonuclease [Candidatus Nanopelagicales bacterium]